MPGAGAQPGGDIRDVAAAEEGDGEIAAGGKGLGGGAGADLGAIFIERDIPNVVDLVFDAPMAAGDSEQVFSAGLIGGQAGDGMGDLRLDLTGGLTDALSLDPADLLEVWPRLAHDAGISEAGVLGGISEGPEDAPLKAPVLGLGWGIHRDRECGAPLLPLALLPERQGRQHGWVR